MNKLLVGGLLSVALIPASFADGVTVCNPGGFYAGLNLGWVAHKAQLKIQEIKPTGKLSDMLKKLADSYTKLKAAKTEADGSYDGKVVETATKAVADAAEKVVAEAAKDSTAAAGGAISIKVGGKEVVTVAGPSTYKAAMDDDEFATAVLTHAEVKGAFAKTDPDAADAFSTLITDATVAAKVQTAINKVVKELVNDAVQTKTSVHGITYADGAFKIDTDEIISATAYKTVTEAQAKLETVKKDDETHKAKVALAEANLKSFTEVFTDKTILKLTDFDTTEKVNAKIKELDAKEKSELGANTNAKRSKSKSGFVAEAVFGFDHRINDMMVGAELYVGFDTSKLTLRDKKVDQARKDGVADKKVKDGVADKKVKDGVADKKVKDGIELKRQFYVGIAPRIGYMFTPQLEGYLMVGAQLSKYRIDTTGAKVIYDNMVGVYNEIKTSMEKRAARETAIADKKAYTTAYEAIDAKTLGGTVEFKKWNKTKFAPVIGLGIRYAFTPDIFGTLQYKYQFNTKVIGFSDKNPFQVKDQNHTITVGVGFRF